jgi:hypothetical protein
MYGQQNIKGSKPGQHILKMSILREEIQNVVDELDCAKRFLIMNIK